jgi:hypothetical protein
MQPISRGIVSRISAETSASVELNEVCRWLIRRQADPLRLPAQDIPALGRCGTLRLAPAVLAPRAVLSAFWLLDDADPGDGLLTGQLRFVAHPIRPEIRLSLSGRSSATAHGLTFRNANLAARQLLDVIAESVGSVAAPERSSASVIPFPASRTGMSAAIRSERFGFE